VIFGIAGEWYPQAAKGSITKDRILGAPFWRLAKGIIFVYGVDILARIKRCVLLGQVRFTLKATIDRLTTSPSLKSTSPWSMPSGLKSD
jgi:hypothetical protein